MMPTHLRRLRWQSTYLLLLALLLGVLLMRSVRSGADLQLRASSIDFSLTVIGREESVEAAVASASSAASDGDSDGRGGHRHGSAVWIFAKRWIRGKEEIHPASSSICNRDRASTAFRDVPTDAWYVDAVREFHMTGYLAHSGKTFRPSHVATRAEFAALLLRLKYQCHSQDAIEDVPTRSFRDVPRNAWYAAALERVAKLGWMKGENNCYGNAVCHARPRSSITRAEAATLVSRALGLRSQGSAQRFSDVRGSMWYARDVGMAARACIMTGDGSTKLFRPLDPINRAEMVTLLQRALEFSLGADVCNTSEPAGSIAATKRLHASATRSTAVPTIIKLGSQQHIRVAPDAPLSSMDFCTDASLVCAKEAVAEDLRAIGSTFLATLTMPNRATWHNTSVSEHWLWIILSLGMGMVIRFCWTRLRGWQALRTK